MKIKTQFGITLFLFGAVLTAAHVVIIIADYKAKTATARENLATAIAQGANELSYLSNDYLIYREDQQVARWQSRFALLSKHLEDLHADAPEEQMLIANINENTRRLKETFDSVLSAAPNFSKNQSVEFSSEFLQISSSRLAVQTQGLFSDAQRLSRLINARLINLRETRTLLIYALLGLLVLFLLAIYMLTYRRTMKSLTVLRNGAKIIGSGNLDYTIEQERDDEIGEVAAAFNQMGADLKTVTASRAELATEIEERKQAEAALSESEERFRLMGDTIPFGAWMSDAKGRNIYISPLFLELVGMTFEQVKEFGWTGKMPPEDVEPAMRRWMECVRTGCDWERELRFPSPDGQWHTILSRGKPVRDAQGEVKAWVGINLDITSRKQAEEALRESIQELEDTNRELESFIYSVSHDLRSPLRTISAFIAFLKKDYSGTLDDRAKDYLSRIHNGSAKMSRLIEDMLHLSRIARQEVNREDIDLSSLGHSVIADLRAVEPGRKVEVVIPERLTAFADPRLMGMVFSNLLGNAWKFTARVERARIELGAGKQNGQIVYYVRDNGAGFDPAYVHQMFRPFHRLHSEEEFEGTGIGLAIVDRIIRRHNGGIWAEGAPGKGATIYFTLQ